MAGSIAPAVARQAGRRTPHTATRRDKMVLDALVIMLFGMLGIFIVMGIIILVIMLLKKFSKS